MKNGRENISTLVSLLIWTINSNFHSFKNMEEIRNTLAGISPCTNFSLYILSSMYRYSCYKYTDVTLTQARKSTHWVIFFPRCGVAISCRFLVLSQLISLSGRVCAPTFFPRFSVRFLLTTSSCCFNIQFKKGWQKIYSNSSRIAGWIVVQISGRLVWSHRCRIYEIFTNI